jgi:hypothetical protein
MVTTGAVGGLVVVTSNGYKGDLYFVKCFLGIRVDQHMEVERRLPILQPRCLQMPVKMMASA